uniref:Large ribosomal subunit protein eL28 n=1 Tax=Sus scrofa TaxID=9823 RepID=A0A8D0NEL1_PIG
MLVHLQWMVVQICSSFLIKKNKQTYNMEPNNLKARYSFCYNGLIHHTTVGVEPADDKRDRGMMNECSVVLSSFFGTFCNSTYQLIIYYLVMLE